MLSLADRPFAGGELIARHRRGVCGQHPAAVPGRPDDRRHRRRPTRSGPPAGTTTTPSIPRCSPAYASWRRPLGAAMVAGSRPAPRARALRLRQPHDRRQYRRERHPLPRRLPVFAAGRPERRFHRAGAAAEGYCHPIRFGDAGQRAGSVPQALLDKLPPAAAYEVAVFPTLEEQEAGWQPWSRTAGTRQSARTSSSFLAGPGYAPGPRTSSTAMAATPSPHCPPAPGRGSACCRSLIFAVLFLILPTCNRRRRLPDAGWRLHTANIASLVHTIHPHVFWISIRISFASAFLGA